MVGNKYSSKQKITEMVSILFLILIIFFLILKGFNLDIFFSCFLKKTKNITGLLVWLQVWVNTCWRACVCIQRVYMCVYVYNSRRRTGDNKITKICYTASCNNMTLIRRKIDFGIELSPQFLYFQALFYSWFYAFYFNF